MALTRGEVYRVRYGGPGADSDPKRSRCFVVVGRQTLLDSKSDRVLCAPINTREVGLVTEVAVAVSEGLKHPSAVNCDQLVRLDKSALTDYIGMLSANKLLELKSALRAALDID